MLDTQSPPLDRQEVPAGPSRFWLLIVALANLLIVLTIANALLA